MLYLIFLRDCQYYLILKQSNINTTVEYSKLVVMDVKYFTLETLSPSIYTAP